MRLKHVVLAALGLIALAGAAYAGGIYVNGMPLASYPLTGNEQFGVDTQLAAGINPQSEAVSVSQMYAYAKQTTLTDAATITPDLSASRTFEVVLGGNRTLANPTNLQAGDSWVVVVKQDGTGSRTLTYGNNYYWASSNAYGPTVGTAPTLTTTANAANILELYYDGKSILGNLR